MILRFLDFAIKLAQKHCGHTKEEEEMREGGEKYLHRMENDL